LFLAEKLFRNIIFRIDHITLPELLISVIHDL
jgi:hypothetical protein